MASGAHSLQHVAKILTESKMAVSSSSLGTRWEGPDEAEEEEEEGGMEGQTRVPLCCFKLGTSLSRQQETTSSSAYAQDSPGSTLVSRHTRNSLPEGGGEGEGPSEVVEGGGGGGGGEVESLDSLEFTCTASRRTHPTRAAMRSAST